MGVKLMNWGTLLNGNRRRPSTTRDKHRNEFDKDYDRIIPSSSLRRLNDKTQVFPLQKNDFIRTRLTHSLEVSALGRSLGMLVAEKLYEKGEIGEKDKPQIASLLCVASLVHDIGNPPFGHYGEDVIRKWFNNWFLSEEYKKIEEEWEEGALTKAQKNDFRYFEGNAQGLRILTKLQFLNDENGINFTYGTLGTLIKYPCSSIDMGEKGYKKFGYFQSEEEIYNIIQAETKTKGKKHPLNYLLKAADEIAYLLADIEDGVKKGFINWEEIYKSEFKDWLKECYYDKYNYLEEKREDARKNNVPEKDLIDVQNFRIIVQGIMINEVANTFIENYDDIMRGEIKEDLLKISRVSKLRDKLENIGIEYCYQSPEVLNLELVGDSVISGLLDIFIPALTYKNVNISRKTREGKLFNVISKNYRHVHSLNFKYKIVCEDNDGITLNLDLYSRIQLVTDFISGMTDSYAVDLYQKLKGVKLP